MKISFELGAEFRNNLICAQFNLRAVSRHELVPSGSAFTTRDSAFVSSDDPDFHPTDVIEDAAGNRLVLTDVGQSEEPPSLGMLPLLPRAPLPAAVTAVLERIAQRGAEYEAIAKLSVEVIEQIYAF